MPSLVWTDSESDIFHAGFRFKNLCVALSHITKWSETPPALSRLAKVCRKWYKGKYGTAARDERADALQDRIAVD